MPHATLLIKPVSDNCNMRCRYCFYNDVAKHRDVPSYGVMKPETLDALVRKALSFADGSCSFGFQGGEPTLAGLDFFKETVRLQLEYNYGNIPIANSIQTNGYRLGPEWAEFFRENNFLVGLSIDGVKHAHDSFRLGPDGAGTYERAMETAEMFVRQGVEFNILCVINNVVASYPVETYNALKKYKYLQFIPCLEGFDSLGPSPFTLDNDMYAGFLNATFGCYYADFMRGAYVSVRNFDNYVNILAGRPPEQCGMNGVCSCYFLIEADGSVYPCDFYVLDEWRIGNVNVNSFAKMIKNDAARRFIEVSHQIHEDCAACGWYGICRGGCRRYREPALGGVLAKNRHCGAFIDFFSHSFDKMMKMVEKLKHDAETAI